MTKLIYASILSIISTGLLLFTSCEKDTSLDKTPNKVNEWIYETMKKEYLWNDEIAATYQPSDNKPTDYFESLLSKKDGKHVDDDDYFYSYIEEDVTTKSDGREKTRGINSTPYVFRSGDMNVFIQINYVEKSSPAERAGLKRGDWISHYNNIKLTQKNFRDFYSFSGDMTITVGYIDNVEFVKTKDVKVGPAEEISLNPVYLDTTYLVNNKKIAYLMYNRFVSGETDDDKIYDDQLRSVFNKFSSNKPDELILDLRYNPGGFLTCAQLLATMIVEESALNKVFCKLVYNKTKGTTDEIKFDKNDIAPGKNLNLKRLYIITGKRTASSSELIINGLRPDMDVILVGSKTEGKNVGSQEYSGKSKNHPWILHPITCYVENSEGFRDYADGFTPNFEAYEPINFIELGNTKEYMLSQTLNVIETGSLRASLRNTEGIFHQLPQPQKGIRGIIIE